MNPTDEYSVYGTVCHGLSANPNVRIRRRVDAPCEKYSQPMSHSFGSLAMPKVEPTSCR